MHFCRLVSYESLVGSITTCSHQPISILDLSFLHLLPFCALGKQTWLTGRTQKDRDRFDGSASSAPRQPMLRAIRDGTRKPLTLVRSTQPFLRDRFRSTASCMHRRNRRRRKRRRKRKRRRTGASARTTKKGKIKGELEVIDLESLTPFTFCRWSGPGAPRRSLAAQSKQLSKCTRRCAKRNGAEAEGALTTAQCSGCSSHTNTGARGTREGLASPRRTRQRDGASDDGCVLAGPEACGPAEDELCAPKGRQRMHGPPVIFMSGLG